MYHENVCFILQELSKLIDLAVTFDRFVAQLTCNNSINPLNAKITKWSNTLKQFTSKLPTNFLSVFDHFVGLAFKGLIELLHVNCATNLKGLRNAFITKMNTAKIHLTSLFHHYMLHICNGIVVKVLDSKSRGPIFKTTESLED